MDKGVKSMKKLIGREGPPVVNVKDPFAHFHPRRQRVVARQIYKDMKDNDVTFEQVKELARSINV